MRHSFAGLALAALVLLSSCREAKVESYRVAKEVPKPAAPTTPNAPMSGPFSGGAQMPAAGGTMASTPVTTASGESLKWTAPAHWKTKAASAMRKGSYGIPGENETEADLSITAFPGDVGGDLANANRWRQQLQLASFTEAELAKAGVHLEAGGLHLLVLDFSGDNKRTLGAIVPYNGSTWFFKLTGPEVIVAKEKDAFMAFLATIKQP